MIRITVAAALLATTPVLAQQDVQTQYQAANQMFAAGAVGPMEYFVRARTSLLEGLGGMWLYMSPLGPVDDETLATVCAAMPVTITVRDAYSFDFAQSYDNGAKTLVTRYSSRGGNVFGVHVDPAALFERLGFSEDTPPPDGVQLSTLNGSNGIATLVRPSPDILVIQANYGPPQIYARCAMPPPVPPS